MGMMVKDISGNGNHGTLIGFPNPRATCPEESAHPELWEGLCDRGGIWHLAENGSWSLDFNGRGSP